MPKHQSSDERVYLVAATNPAGEWVSFATEHLDRAEAEYAHLAALYPAVYKAWEDNGPIPDAAAPGASDPLAEFQMVGEDEEGSCTLIRTNDLDSLYSHYVDIKARCQNIHGNPLFEATRPLFDMEHEAESETKQ